MLPSKTFFQVARPKAPPPPTLFPGGLDGWDGRWGLPPSVEGGVGLDLPGALGWSAAGTRVVCKGVHL